MKQLVAILIILSFAAPVRAQLPAGFEPVEKKLIDQQLQGELSKGVGTEAPMKSEAKGGSNWWKWTLGIIAIVGIAAAAGGGGGGGGSSPPPSTGGTPPPTTSSTTVHW
jgi:hypothetical protein